MGDVVGGCLQIPTTLPTFDELIGIDGRDADAAATEILKLSRSPAGDAHAVAATDAAVMDALAGSLHRSTGPGAPRQRGGGDHVFTLHAELEGQQLLPQFQYLLENWLREGRRVVSMQEYAAQLDLTAIPRARIIMGEVAGRSGALAVQAAIQSGVAAGGAGA
jgi:hypothetical protein